MKVHFALLLLCSMRLALAQTGTESGILAERDAHYRLQSEDKIDVQYRYTPEHNASASVQPDGYVSLPLVGELKLAGLTLEEARAAIRKRANVSLNEPDVIVLLKEYVKPYFVLAGEVARPGRVDLHGPVTLVEAIALGGGFKDSARRTQVVLLRKSSGEMAEVKVFDLRKLMSQSGIREEVSIRPGDMLIVPRNTISKIEPYVRISDAGLYGLAAKFL
jgi:polysaccharide export outer membrane protein